MLTKAPRGTNDWFGKDMLIRRKVESIMRDICKHYHIQEIATPIFEHTELFQRSVGETTDVVQKEMYTFNDKADRSITLKPEGTAGVVRAFLEHSMYGESQPTKLFYLTPVFRYEKPQAGRYRQHHQFGVEFFGSKEPQVEVALILLIKDLLKQLGIQDAKLHINSIGCGDCRKEYNTVLMDFFEAHREEFCETCKGRMTKNPLRVLDCKVPSCQKLVQNAPKTIDHLDEECQVHFDTLLGLLTALGIEYEVDPNVVRGLDYYTKTVFEFINSEGLTLCGGGRYDTLVNEIGDKDMPAVGFGMGIERILMLLAQEKIDLKVEQPLEIYVGILGSTATAEAFRLVHQLREKGIVAETDYLNRSIKAQMKYANKLGALYTVIIGDNEINENKISVKSMETGEQTEMKIDQLVEFMIENKKER